MSENCELSTLKLNDIIIHTAKHFFCWTCPFITIFACRPWYHLLQLGGVLGSTCDVIQYSPHKNIQALIAPIFPPSPESCMALIAPSLHPINDNPVPYMQCVAIDLSTLVDVCMTSERLCVCVSRDQLCWTVSREV